MRVFIVTAWRDKRIRFLIVGVLNTMVGYGSYALFLAMGGHYILANMVSTVIGIVHSYFWNKFFTFRVIEKSKSELRRFLSVYGFSYLMNLGILFVVVELLKVNTYLAGIVCLLVTTLLSYIGHNKFSFKQVD